MDYLRLLIALFVPWLAGYSCLTAVESRLGATSPNKFRQIGYGFFLGYASLVGVIHGADTFIGTVNFWPIVVAFACIAITAWQMKKLPDTAQRPTPVPAETGWSWQTTIIALCLAAIGLQLLFSVMEVLLRPTYAWDAWTTWNYRAKAWFFSEDIYQLAKPMEWLKDPEGVGHAIPAYGYPTLPSVVAFWAATALGYWSDTLVNTPVLLCGAALCMAIYGACREHGLGILGSVIAVYLFISMPFVGAHISLAGYGDIWLAGFTGLGFIALLRGLGEPNRLQVGSGVLFLALGCTVKLEGLAWLMLALALITTCAIPRNRISGILFFVAGLAAAIVLTLGLTSVQLPFLGTVGVTDGRLHIPFVGSYAVVTYNVFPIYYDSFFHKGSWHLLWPLLVGAMIALPFIRNSRLRFTFITFLLLFLGAQLCIFGLTEKGLFAESNTAVNRLLIHFLPAVVFTMAVVIHQLFLGTFPGEHMQGTSKATAPNFTAGYILIPLVATVIAASTLITSWQLKHAQDASATPAAQIKSEIYWPGGLSPVMGGGRANGHQLVLDKFERGMIIASSGAIDIAALHYPVVAYDIKGSIHGAAMLFWRQKSNPKDIQMLTIDPLDESSLYLAGHPQWQGQVIELGLIFYEADAPYAVHQLELQPWANADKLEIVSDDWITFEPITQKFINWIDNGRKHQILSLTSFTALIFFITLLGFTLLSAFGKAKPGQLLLGSTGAAIALWAISDAMWLSNRLHQTQVTLESYRGRQTPIEDLRAREGFPFEFVAESVIANMPDGEKEILVIPYTTRMWFEAAKLRYHLLPLESFALEGGINALPASWDNVILVVKDPRQSSHTIRQDASDKLGGKVDILLENQNVILLQPSAQWPEKNTSTEQ